MKKNKNGFTLVEILVTIAVLAVLTTIVGVSVSQILHNNNQKKVDDFGDKICAAALTYIDYQGINKSLCSETAYPDLCEVTYEELLQGKDTQLAADLKVKENDESNGFIKSNLVNPEIKNKDENTIANIVSTDEGKKTIAACISFSTDGEKTCTYRSLNSTDETCPK